LAIELIDSFQYDTATVPYESARSKPIPKSWLLYIAGKCWVFGGYKANDVKASKIKRADAAKR